MNPMAYGASVAVRTFAACSVTPSGGWAEWMPPNDPIPPAFDTAAARVPPLCIAIGADMIGCSSPKSSVKRVWSMSARSFLQDYDTVAVAVVEGLPAAKCRHQDGFGRAVN